jgi:hypothetical protein
MNTIPTDPDEIRDRLAEECSLIYEGLLIGSEKVKEYFDLLKHSLNPALAANLARYHARQHATSRKRLGSEFFFEEVPNNGIVLRRDWCELKVLKGRDGEPPTATKTNRSRRFYSQSSQRSLPGIDWNGLLESVDWKTFVAGKSKLNLILCWEVDETYGISNVQLMCPRSSGKYGQGVKLFWRRQVAHPVYGIKGLRGVNDDADVDDIDIFFEDTGEQDPE